MVRIIILFLGSLVLSVPVSAQEWKQQAGSSLGINRLDFWHEFSYSLRKEKWEAELGAGYGINKTWFQGRLFPRFSAGGTWYGVNRPKFLLGPHVQVGAYYLRYSKSDQASVNWYDGVGGIKWSYGTRWQISQVIAAGYYTERYYSTLYGRKMNAGNWAYYTRIALRYVF